MLTLMKSYLAERSQSVGVDEKYSEAFTVISGSPQGSCLGGQILNSYSSNVLTLVKLFRNCELVTYSKDQTAVKKIGTVEKEERIPDLPNENRNILLHPSATQVEPNPLDVFIS